MYHVYPNYYKHFSCIKGACRHSCCIGWEIDIDEYALAYYDAMEGEIGERIRQAIDREGTPHFRLSTEGRCPFLTSDGLCDLILTLGENALCHICRQHPRFYNFIGDRIEIGLGLACEAAARLILLSKEPMKLEIAEKLPVAEINPVITFRDEAIRALQDRSQSIEERIRHCRTLCRVLPQTESVADRIPMFLELEQLAPEWTDLLHRLETKIDTINFAAFDAYMAGREHEAEQLLVYFAYRYLINGHTVSNFDALFLMVEVLYRLFRALAAMRFSETGSFTPDDTVELARMLSAEIEYSDENICDLQMTLEDEQFFAKLDAEDTYILPDEDMQNE